MCFTAVTRALERMRRAAAVRLHSASILLAAAAAAGLLYPSAEPRAAQDASAAAKPYRETIPGTVVAFEMVPVPGGTVTVDGKPVTVAPFHIGQTEVTWDMYDVFTQRRDEEQSGTGADAIARPSQPYGAPDYGWGHTGYPAISIAQPAAVAFGKWLSARTGRTYRLPTEAEWVRAAELAAGVATPEIREATTWHRGNAKGTTHPVGKRKPDALGLFDLFGNAAEWVTTPDDDFVTRGGSFRDPLEVTGPAARALQDDTWNERDPQLPKSSWWLSDGPFVGFRLVSPVAP